MACRTDGMLSFIALAQQLGTNFKSSTWKSVLRWAHYLVDRAGEFVLSFVAPPSPTSFAGSADASAVNANDEDGMLASSFTAGGAHFPGSGMCDWFCKAPRGGVAAPAHSELRGMVETAKLLVSLRMICRELRWLPTEPTRLYGDSKAAFDGALMERLPAKERFLAAQRGMMRMYFKEKILLFVRVPGDLLRPDLMTKADHTSFKSDCLAYWCQVGCPHPDDRYRTEAVPRTEGAAGGAGVATVSSVAVGMEIVEWVDTEPGAAVDEAGRTAGEPAASTAVPPGRAADELAVQTERAVSIPPPEAVARGRAQKAALKRAAKDLRETERRLAAEVEAVRVEARAAAVAGAAAQQRELEQLKAEHMQKVQVLQHTVSTLTGQTKARRGTRVTWPKVRDDTTPVLRTRAGSWYLDRVKALALASQSRGTARRRLRWAPGTRDTPTSSLRAREPGAAPQPRSGEE